MKSKKWISLLSIVSIPAIATPILLVKNSNNIKSVETSNANLKTLITTDSSKSEELLVLENFLAKLNETISSREYLYNNIDYSTVYQSMINSQNSFRNFYDDNQSFLTHVQKQYNYLSSIYSENDNLVQGYIKMVPLKYRKNSIITSKLNIILFAEKSLSDSIQKRINEINSTDTTEPTDNSQAIEELSVTKSLISELSNQRSTYFEDVSNMQKFNKLLLTVSKIDNKISNSVNISNQEKLRNEIASLLYLLNNLEVYKWSAFATIVESFEKTLIQQENIVNQEIINYEKTL